MRMDHAGVERQGTQGRASFCRLKCREFATCVHGPRHCGRLGGTLGRNTWRGCERRSAGVHGSRGGRTAGEKKIFCRVTTRGRKVRLLGILRRGFRLLAARALGCSLLGFDFRRLAAFRLPPGGLPAANQLLALSFLAIALVPSPRRVLPLAILAEAHSETRAARSGGASLV